MGRTRTNAPAPPQSTDYGRLARKAHPPYPQYMYKTMYMYIALTNVCWYTYTIVYVIVYEKSLTATGTVLFHN